jgi:hypothetical protein
MLLMTLLEEIQEAAVDASVDLSTLLRRCKLLSARLGSRPLETWLLLEANGYPKDVEVPDYRVWPLSLKGHFAGPFGSGIRNAPIPLATLPPEARDAYEHFEYRASVASVEAGLKVADGPLQVSTGDLAMVLGMKVYQGQNCVQAWAEFSGAHLVELLNAVRNRVLDFALAIWKESPQAGEASNATAGLTTERITQIFNTTVYGGSANLIGSAIASSIVVRIGIGDLASLEQALVQHGVAMQDIEELRAAVLAEPTPRARKLGPKVSAWIASMMGKAASGTWEVGIATAGTVLGEAIAKYYGF